MLKKIRDLLWKVATWPECESWNPVVNEPAISQAPEPAIEPPKPVKSVMSCGTGILPPKAEYGLLPPGPPPRGKHGVTLVPPVRGTANFIVPAAPNLTGEEDLPAVGPTGNDWCPGQVEQAPDSGPRQEAYKEIILSEAYPNMQFKRGIPKPGQYFWGEGCLIQVSDEGFGAEDAKVERWVLQTDVWYGEKGYARDPSWATVIKPSEDAWPHEKMLGKIPVVGSCRPPGITLREALNDYSNGQPIRKAAVKAKRKAAAKKAAPKRAKRKTVTKKKS